MPCSSAADLVLTDRREHVLIVTINRPECRNAVDAATAGQLEQAMDLLDDDDDLFAGVVTGAGGTFSAGADLKAAARGEKAVTPRRGGFGVFRRPPRKPLIAAVEGFAVGGGFELCLSCDLIVAAADARFGLPEVRHNGVAAGGGLFRLPKRLPYHLAVELALTGAFRDAEFFHRWGVVNRVVPAGASLDAAVELAESLQANGPTAVMASKEIIFRSSSWATEEEAWEAQQPIAARALDSEDRREGLAAFAEKREPRWVGR
ncbi:crotonase/enoyl-CoA hydratase family protein [Saccharopolyspora oryzae]|uniref:Crotonase/enoyl-CoA hydratase family protein n=1 Tax=Saccharopolyspora oryzae TaxID=2997343 RepID=A0ABT4UQM1_9PSEU|nr:crotonase/enoyl-CoA hydratase family protein [Saccharopolyspora oryzae]MDA3623997.1 crotonase/enoyl-CoA hydratase family protein [Saccharopolyspora oryzae]